MNCYPVSGLSSDCAALVGSCKPSFSRATSRGSSSGIKRSVKETSDGWRRTHCLFIGNLGRDAEGEVHRRRPGGGEVLDSLHAEQWTGKDGQRHEKRTEWVNVEVWGRTAEAVGGNMVKGKQVFVRGKLQTDEYTDRRW